VIIGIDASRALRARRTGTENYALELIRQLLAQGREHRFRLYCDQPPAPTLFGNTANAEIRVIHWPRLWTHVRLSWEMVRRPPDVLFVPAHVLPLVCPSRSVVTVHDLGYLHYPEAHTHWQRAYLAWSTRWSARHATHLLADSIATRDDVLAQGLAPAEKLTVVYPGRDQTMRPVSDRETLSALRFRLDLGPRYVLHVGTLHPRKNLVRLIEAFALLGDEGLQLALCGERGWLPRSIERRVQELGIADRVRLVGYVDDRDLAALYSAAACFAYPSLFEGFGFPVLEAQACGTPVVASNSSSIPEVAGDAAVLVDPLDTTSISRGLERALNDEELRRGLVERGFANVARFSWVRCAEQTLDVLEMAGTSP
jgi:glycosyltransferase involved in cell wall biosynthesis